MLESTQHSVPTAVPCEPARARPFDTRLLFRDIAREHDFEPLAVEGTVPEALQGTLYRNGPGIFTSVEGHRRHPFDGEGAITATRFQAGRALGAVRVTPTQARLRERARGRSSYAGYDYFPDGMARFFKPLKPNANTHVVPWRGTLLALWEGARPVALEPHTLESLGAIDGNGAIRGAFSAHPHRVPARRALYNFGLDTRLTRKGLNAKLTLMELPDRGPARMLGELDAGPPTMVHDFIATERHFVFFLVPIEVDALPVVTTRRTISESIRYRPERGTQILVVPIDEPTRVVRIEAPALHVWHFVNAHERGSELVVNFVRFPNLDSLEGLTRMWHGEPACGYEGELNRARIDLARRSVGFERITSRFCEFPRVHPELEAGRARYVYTSGYATRELPTRGGVQGTITRTDLESGDEQCFHFAEHEQVSEPVFVPRPGARSEDDGYVLTQILDATRERASVAVLDALDLSRGPVARAWFDQPLPMTFHGSFLPHA